MPDILTCVICKKPIPEHPPGWRGGCDPWPINKTGRCCQKCDDEHVTPARILGVAGYQSFAPQVVADSSGEWAGNGLRFATRAEAEANVANLASRWLLVRETRVVPSKDPVNYRWDSEKGLVQVGE